MHVPLWESVLIEEIEIAPSTVHQVQVQGVIENLHRNVEDHQEERSIGDEAKAW